MTIDRAAFFCFRARRPWGRRQIFQVGARQESKSSGPVRAKVKPYRVGAISGWGGAGRGRAVLPASNSAKSVLLCFISVHYLWQLINAAGTFECNEDDCKQGYTNWRANYGCICIKVTMHLPGCIYVFYATLSNSQCITQCNRWNLSVDGNIITSSYHGQPWLY